MPMDAQQLSAKQRELEELRQRVAALESELGGQTAEPWQARDYYTAYYATAGFMLGMFGALTSLLFNVIGSVLYGQHPLKLIQVYLTFPLGAKALSPQMDSGLALAIGCCLYIATGMILGIPFHLLMTRVTGGSPKTSLTIRLAVATFFSLALWLINFYLILAWLQPLLFDGNWIVEEIPWWVAATTHLVFGWTMALVYPWGLYTPYRLQTADQS
jgi:hypothetical protein